MTVGSMPYTCKEGEGVGWIASTRSRDDDERESRDGGYCDKSKAAGKDTTLN